MDLSIVTTMYCSAPYLEEFYRRITNSAKKITCNYEIILVNDGSPDNSLEIAIGLHRRDARVKVVDLSRNFGHHKAILTGLSHTTGKMVFLIDCDLEEEPELLETFYEKFQTSGMDVVYGVQKKRKGRFFERISGSIFYWVFNKLTSNLIPPNILTVRLMSRRYVMNLIAHREREVFLPGLLVMTGFRQIALEVHKHSKATTTYTLSRKISLVVNAVTSFSSSPLIFIFYLGFFISLISGAAGLMVLIRKLFFQGLLMGWPSLIISVWLLGGITVFCLGIIGIYLSRVFSETKQRPYTIVRELYSNPSAENDDQEQVERTFEESLLANKPKQIFHASKTVVG